MAKTKSGQKAPKDVLEQHDFLAATAILDAAARAGFETPCDGQIEQLFLNRPKAMARFMTEIGRSAEVSQVSHSRTWASSTTPPLANHWTTRGVENAEVENQRLWGEHMLSLMRLGFQPQTAWSWGRHLCGGHIGAISAIDAICSTFYAENHPTCYSGSLSYPHREGFSDAYAGDGPQAVASIRRMAELGLLRGPNPLITHTDLYAAGAIHCAEAALKAGAGFQRAAHGAHGEHGLWIPGALAARILSEEDHMASQKKGHTPPTQSALEWARASREIAAKGWPGALRFDAMADIQLIKKRQAIEGAAQLRETLTLIELEAKKLPEGGSPENYARATGELAGALLFKATDGHRYDLDSLGRAIRGNWEPLAKRVLSEAEANGLDIKEHADAICASALDSAYDYWISKNAAKIVIDAALDAFGRKLGPKCLGPETFNKLCRANHLAAARKAFDGGVASDFEHPERGSPLTILASHSGKAAAKLALDILRKNPRLASSTPSSGRLKGIQPLHLACKSMDAPLIEALLELGADPNARDADGATPLRHLLSARSKDAQAASESVAKKLLAAGADPHLRDSRGRTPAQAAAKTGSFAALCLLFSTQPDVLSEKGQAASRARSLLKSRADGRSLMESVELDSLLGAADGSAADAPPRQPASSGAKTRL